MDRVIGIDGSRPDGMLSNISEQRFECRYQVDIKAELTSEQGETSFCAITNLSLSGFQLRLAAAAVKVIMPPSQSHGLHQPVHFQLDFTVPTTQCVDAPVTIDSAMVYCRRVSQDSFVIGAKFCQFKQNSDVILQDYIEHFASRH